MKKFGFMLLAFGVAINSSQSLADDAGYETYVTCGVYFRMVTGAYRQANQLPLADISAEKMQKIVSEGKRLAIEEFDQAMGEEMYQDAWSDVTMSMQFALNWPPRL